MKRTFCDLCDKEITRENATRSIHHSSMAFMVGKCLYRIESLARPGNHPSEDGQDICRNCVAETIIANFGKSDFWMPSVKP